MSDLSDLVPLPPSNMMNFGLSACRESTMLDKFGKPGKLTNDCSPATGAFKERVKSSVDVGPFRVTGLDFAVESLRQIFDEVARHNEILFDQVKTAGMLCVRHIRHNPARFSPRLTRVVPLCRMCRYIFSDRPLSPSSPL